ncbi:MAG: hypothetical protein IKK19_05255, partial [Bacteroidales bacterium]|nr:hypothetical protein [Bacteroidales bacterium]
DSLDMADETIQKVFVFNNLDGTVSVRRIETGIQDMSHIEVTSGLDTNSLIVTAPFSAISKDLKEGSHVIKTN